MSIDVGITIFFNVAVFNIEGKKYNYLGEGRLEEAVGKIDGSETKAIPERFAEMFSNLLLLEFNTKDTDVINPKDETNSFASQISTFFGDVSEEYTILVRDHKVYLAEIKYSSYVDKMGKQSPFVVNLV